MGFPDRPVRSLAGLGEDQVGPQGLADAAYCRSEADWLVGMNLSRALTIRLRTRKDRSVWSGGRVQTPALAMVVAREREILAAQLRSDLLA